VKDDDISINQLNYVRISYISFLAAAMHDPLGFMRNGNLQLDSGRVKVADCFIAVKVIEKPSLGL